MTRRFDVYPFLGERETTISNRLEPSPHGTLVTVRGEGFIGRRQAAYGNAAMESWNSTFKAECGERFETNEVAEAKAFDFIEVFYNRQRRHSALGMISPAEFERRYRERQAA